MKFTFTFLISLLVCSSLFAQNTYSVKGMVGDTAAHATLVNTSISVLNAKDSTLRRFTRAASDGSFTVDKLGKGKFILLVSYPGYADYVDNFSLDSVKTTHDAGKINMILKTQLLKDVIIKGTRAAMKIKGDTTEFNADAYKIQPNAKVEDLIKQFPGITVDKDGKITAQGQTVTKVLVDGEEFFGDDPTLVTKNLRADMVDKVQLYDKKSDQATFTGIDDGQKTKTLDIKLKADKKNGEFGKADIGAGSDKRYSGQLLFNKFKAKQKLSLYGTLANTGKTGLGWEDNQKYGSSDNLQFGDSGEIYFFGGGGDELDSFNGQYNGQGLPVARTAGMHYDTKWNNDKESLNTNYKLGSLSVDGTNSDLSQNNTPGSVVNTTSDQNYHKYMFRQKLDGVYQLKIDTTSNLKISADGTLKNSDNNSSYKESRVNGDGVLLNKSAKTVTNKNEGKVFDISFFYTKKFKKKGRTFSASISEAYTENKSKGFLKSDADFYNPAGNAVDSTQHIDQYKTSNISNSLLKSNFTYTEPLAKDFSVIANYGLSLDNGVSDRKSFNATSPGVYTSLDPKYSNNYKLNQLFNQVGAIFNYKKGKSNVNFGAKVSGVNFKQTDQVRDTIYKRNFVNFNPQASYQYKFSPQQSLRFEYRGNPTQPTISQIQPVFENNDPLNIIIGNPALKPSFTNNFNVNYNSYKVLSGQSVYLYGNYRFTTNPIVNNTITDITRGKSTSQAINLNKSSSNFYLYGSFGRKTFGGIYIGLDMDANGSTSYNLSNNELNKTTYNTYGGKLRIQKYVEKKYQFYINGGPNYTISGSSLQTLYNNNGRGFNADGSFTVYLPGKFQVSSDASYEFRAKTQTFNTDFKRTLWNASITKAFFKEEKLKLVMSANDLLNQNVGFSRNVSGNFITQSSYTTIKRYFMFSIVYDFNRMGGGLSTKK